MQAQRPFDEVQAVPAAQPAEQAMAQPDDHEGSSVAFDGPEGRQPVPDRPYGTTSHGSFFHLSLLLFVEKPMKISFGGIPLQGSDIAMSQMVRKNNLAD